MKTVSEQHINVSLRVCLSFLDPTMDVPKSLPAGPQHTDILSRNGGSSRHRLWRLQLEILRVLRG
jgi:hypothetical protein